MLAYHNGTFLPLDDVRISPLDPGFSGVAVVDNARTFAGKLFRWKQHTDRLFEDCAACRIPIAADENQLTAIAQHLLSADGGRDRDLHVVTVASPGPTLLMHTKELNRAKYSHFFERGAILRTRHGGSPSFRPLLPPTVKHRSRMLWHVAESDCPPGVDTLLLSETNGVLETSFANVLWVSDGTVFRVERGQVLRGITVDYIEELCSRLGIPFKEGPHMSASDFHRVDEALLTGSGFGICGVSRCDGIAIPWPGPVFRKLYAAFCDDVGCDIAATLTPPPSCGPSRS